MLAADETFVRSALADRLSTIVQNFASALNKQALLWGHISGFDYGITQLLAVCSNAAGLWQESGRVGQSGSGKSTVISLVMRFYDPGSVLIDECDIKGLNLRSLRMRKRLIQQEPALFSTRVYENIKTKVAIARALLKDPSILLLDEAQLTSTVYDADNNIVVLQNERAAEMGRHERLTDLLMQEQTALLELNSVLHYHMVHAVDLT
ncbi:hypothetical protein ACSQ67_006577 [Phaseolus vulgaris]